MADTLKECRESRRELKGLFGIEEGVLARVLQRGVYVCLVTQSCLTLCDSMGCCLPGSSVHVDLQATCWSGLPALLWGIFMTQELNIYIYRYSHTHTYIYTHTHMHM